MPHSRSLESRDDCYINIFSMIYKFLRWARKQLLDKKKMWRGSFQNHKQWRKYACRHLCSYKFSYFIIYKALTVIESYAHKYTQIFGCCAAELAPRPSTTGMKKWKVSNGKNVSRNLTGRWINNSYHSLFYRLYPYLSIILLPPGSETWSAILNHDRSFVF